MLVFCFPSSYLVLAFRGIGASIYLEPKEARMMPAEVLAGQFNLVEYPTLALTLGMVFTIVCKPMQCVTLANDNISFTFLVPCFLEMSFIILSHLLYIIPSFVLL